MKKTITLFTLLFTTLLINAQSISEIRGEIKHFDGNRVSIIKYEEQNMLVLAVDTVHNGKFYLKVPCEEPQKVVFDIYKDGQPYYGREIWIGPGVTTITGNDEPVALWPVENSTRQQQDLNRIERVAFDDQVSMMQWAEQMMGLFKQMREPTLSPDGMARIKAQVDSVRQLTQPARDRIQNATLKLLEEMPVSEVWMDKLEPYALHISRDKNNPAAGTVYKLYSKMTDEDRNTPTGKKISEQLSSTARKETLIGKPFIDAELKDTDGYVRHLADYKGKYILIDFWASWCGPCLMAIPEIREIHTKYKDKITIIGLNLDANPEKWKEETKKHNITWVNLSDGATISDGIFAKYKGLGIPYYILISPEGIITDIWGGYVKGALEKKMSEYVR